MSDPKLEKSSVAAAKSVSSVLGHATALTVSIITAATTAVGDPGVLAAIPVRRRGSKLSDSEDSSLSTDSPLKGGLIASLVLIYLYVTHAGVCRQTAL